MDTLHVAHTTQTYGSLVNFSNGLGPLKIITGGGSEDGEKGFFCLEGS